MSAMPHLLLLDTQVILMMGLPGAGKSTWLQKNIWGSVSLSSADHYRMTDGVYDFEAFPPGDAHQYCLKKFMNDVTGAGTRHHFVVVDNTNLSVAEISPYIQIARVRGFEPRVVLVNVLPKVAFERNKHGLDDETFTYMCSELKRTRETWPKFFPAIEEVSP